MVIGNLLGFMMNSAIINMNSAIYSTIHIYNDIAMLILLSPFGRANSDTIV